MSISKGYTFGATELVTSAKLGDLVDNATISLQQTEIANYMLSSLASISGQIPSYSIIQSMASGSLVRYDGTQGWYAAAS